MADNDLAPEQIIINGREYSPEDAQRLVELGNKWDEIEREQNIKLDSVYPEYTKTTQRAKGLEAELAEARTQLEEFQKKQTAGTETPKDVAEARKAARELGLADEDFLKEKGYMTREQVDQYLTERDNNRAAVEKLNREGEKLETEIDGSDGRVPFIYKNVLAYANTYKIDDLKAAYEEMNERLNRPWKEAQLAKEQSKGLTTLKPGGKKAPERPRITNDNLGEQIGELLASNQLGE